MGTDIHLIAEVRNGDGKWHRVPHFDRACDWCDGSGKYEDGRQCYSCDGAGHRVQRHYHDRNYDVFAMLADVRNGFGFAGVVTGERFAVLAPGRGIPEDLADGVYGYDERLPAIPDEEGDYDYKDPENEAREWAYNIGEHSFTYLTYDELLDEEFWNRETTKRGVVGPKEYEEWKAEGSPQSWSDSVDGGGVIHVSNAEMETLIKYKRVDNAYTEVWWKVTYREQAERFLKRMKETYEHAGSPAPQDFRIVMGFDS